MGLGQARPGLASVYANYLRVNEVGAHAAGHVHPVVAAGGRLNVSQYAGDLDDIERLGFALTWDVNRGVRAARLELADLERLAAHPGVLKMSYGRHPRSTLDKSVPDTKANQIWLFANGAFGGTSAGPSTERARRHR